MIGFVAAVDRLPRMSDTHTVHVEPGGHCFTASPAQTLLAAALQAGVPLRSACRNGSCRACLSHLVQGQVHYLVDWPGVSREEQAEGAVLPCVAQPRSDIRLQAGRLLWG